MKIAKVLKILLISFLVFQLPACLEESSGTNGADGIQMAENERPDLILMDMSLPVIDGWEATRRIKTDEKLKDIPIIALTAHAMSGDEERALAAGCDGYLAKPLDEDLLFEKLDHLLGNNQ